MPSRTNARQLFAYTAVLALLALGAGLLGAGPFRAVGRADNGVTWHPVTSSPGVQGLKSPVRGLLDRHKYPKGYDSVIKSFVIDVAWSDLQATPGGPLVHPNPIDSALAQAASAGMRVKLRVAAGIDAPEWAKRIGGEPIPVYYTKATAKYAGQLAGTIGRFWLPAFGAAYDDLQQKLAAAYDDNPVLGQVAVTRCSTIFSETYLRNTSEKRNVDALLAAGFTRAADDVCHEEQLRSHLVWVHTRSSVTFNAYTAISPDGTVKQDLPYALSQMVECRQVLGRRCVLENYSLASSRLTSRQYPQLYTKMQQLGPPFDFQTATIAKVGDLLEVLDYARSIGATSVELPKGYDMYTPAQLVPFDQALRANTIG